MTHGGWNDDCQWHCGLSSLFEPFDNKVPGIFKMTKLMQWLCFLGVTFTVWFSLLADVLPLKLSEKAKEVVFPVGGQCS